MSGGVEHPEGLDMTPFVAGALKGTYATEFPNADDEDWRADAEFVLARFQEYGLVLRPTGNRDETGLRERIDALENDSPDTAEARGWARHREAVLTLLGSLDECASCGHSDHSARPCPYDGMIPCGCGTTATLTPEDVAEWLRRSDGRIEDIFGLWVQGKRDGKWVGERLIEEGHLAALRDEQDIEDIIDSDGRLLPRGLR